MVPFIPERIPKLATKNIFMGAGKHDPIVSKEQTNTIYYALVYNYVDSLIATRSS
jgi:predicted esterase